MFIEEIKKQGKPFGLLIDDIAGGFTFTGRGQPQAFQVEPLVVYKVYADGRPDELVRGVDIVGTPLLSLTKIVATGDTTRSVQRILRRGIRIHPSCRGRAGNAHQRNGSAEERIVRRTHRRFCRSHFTISWRSEARKEITN